MGLTAMVLSLHRLTHHRDGRHLHFFEVEGFANFEDKFRKTLGLCVV